MKKSKCAVALICVLALLLALRPCGALADGPKVRIVNASYDGRMLRGEITAPEGTYYARVTVCLPQSTFYALILPIGPDGTFGLDIATNCEYIGIEIVDTPEALVPGNWTYYDAAPAVMMDGR